MSKKEHRSVRTYTRAQTPAEAQESAPSQVERTHTRDVHLRTRIWRRTGAPSMLVVRTKASTIQGVWIRLKLDIRMLMAFFDPDSADLIPSWAFIPTFSYFLSHRFFWDAVYISGINSSLIARKCRSRRRIVGSLERVNKGINEPQNSKHVGTNW